MKRLLIATLLLSSVATTVTAFEFHIGQLARNWQELSPDERDRAERGKEKYKSLPEGERGHFERNRQIWQNLSPEKRQDLRKRFDEHRDRD